MARSVLSAFFFVIHLIYRNCCITFLINATTLGGHFQRLRRGCTNLGGLPRFPQYILSNVCNHGKTNTAFQLSKFVKIRDANYCGHVTCSMCVSHVFANALWESLTSDVLITLPWKFLTLGTFLPFSLIRCGLVNALIHHIIGGFVSTLSTCCNIG